MFYQMKKSHSDSHPRNDSTGGQAIIDLLERCESEGLQLPLTLSPEGRTAGS